MSQDEQFIRESIKIAELSVDRGNHPFGALLIDEDNTILAASENTQITDNDITKHAELNLVSTVSKLKLPKEKLKKCTLYTSTEPCAMCSGAICWLRLGRVVYGCSSIEMSKITGGGSFKVPCRDIFAHSKDITEVIGPVLEEESLDIHLGFWPTFLKNKQNT
jgi:tRNA(Arg) A34 adenosine deaminase TadA